MKIDNSIIGEFVFEQDGNFKIMDKRGCLLMQYKFRDQATAMFYTKKRLAEWNSYLKSKFEIENENEIENRN